MNGYPVLNLAEGAIEDTEATHYVAGRPYPNL